MYLFLHLISSDPWRIGFPLAAPLAAASPPKSGSPPESESPRKNANLKVGFLVRDMVLNAHRRLFPVGPEKKRTQTLKPKHVSAAECTRKVRKLKHNVNTFFAEKSFLCETKRQSVG